MKSVVSKDKYYPTLILAAGLLACAVLAYNLVRAEEVRDWYTAQASLLAILLLLALIVWGWWTANRKPAPILPVEAATYRAALCSVTVLVASGFTVLILGANRRAYWENGVVAKAIGYATLAGGAFFVFGVLVGLLFGFRPTGAHNVGDQSSSARPHPYTNLEEIADWLTKLILGAGLVELTKLPEPLRKFAYFMAKGVTPLHTPTDLAGSPAVVLAIMGFFSASGILYGFLWKRYECAVTLDASNADTSALALVDNWLGAISTPDNPARVEMMKAIKSASLAAKLRIFLQAEEYRQPATQDVNERSLPIFQALVESDLQEMFHRNRGQYALALMGKKKDPKNPDADWSQALDWLSNAIRIRDASGEKGWHEYELARAVCQIHLDPNFKKGQASTVEEKRSILADLDKAKHIPTAISKVIDNDDVINQWKAISGNVT